MPRTLEHAINVLASLITIGLFVVSIIPGAMAPSQAILVLRLGEETRVAALLLTQLALLYIARVAFKRVMTSAPVDSDQTTGALVALATLVIIGWASSLNQNFFFPPNEASDSLLRSIYVVVFVIFGATIISDGLETTAEGSNVNSDSK